MSFSILDVPKEATTLHDTTTLTQIKSSEYSLPSEISSLLILVCLSTVVGDEKLTSREDLVGLLFFYVQSDEDTFLKVDEVSKTEAQSFDVFNQLISCFKFCV